jgi:2-oxoglutarate/2-oxoacid ferredoxin oxidoreductase subunit beta
MADQKIQYKSTEKAVFCPGCGDFGVTASMIKALTELGIEKSKVMVVTGIGCSSSIANQFATYGIHGLHGRLVPIASGAKLANPELTVIGAGGDGDGYGIGVGHLIHAARRNLDITYVIMNNEIYGLTTGQASPTSFMGTKTKSSPFGVIESPINPISLALSAGATYVARGFSGDPNHLATLIKNGIMHKGFAIIDVFSPCVTFNHTNTYEWFRPRIYKLEEKAHDTGSISQAMERAIEMDIDTNKIPIGLFYKVQKATYEDLDVTKAEGAVSKMSAPTKETMNEIMGQYK